MSDTAVPHISLALSPGREARELGQMVWQGTELTDWTDCGLPGVHVSPSTTMYRISLSSDFNSSVLEHVLISRHHGREGTDHEDAQALIDSLPSTLWSSGPFDVGHCSAATPISIEVAEGSHVFRPRYRWAPEADDGMEDAVTGL